MNILKIQKQKVIFYFSVAIGHKRATLKHLFSELIFWQQGIQEESLSPQACRFTKLRSLGAELIKSVRCFAN